MDSAGMDHAPAHEANPSPTAGGRRTSGRPKMNSYTDLLKPGESWEDLPDAAQRRKIQNRLAQRAYRRNLRDRTKEVEQLKNQVKELQQAMTTSNGSATELDENMIRTSSQESESPARSEEVVAEPEWHGTYLDGWTVTPEHDMLRQCLNWPTDLDQELHDCYGKNSDTSIHGSAPVSSVSPNLSTSASSGSGQHSVSWPASEAHDDFQPLDMDDSIFYTNPPSPGTIADAQRMVFPHLDPEPCVDEPLIHLAISRGTVNSLRLLLNTYPLLINVRDKAGYTPLQRAIISGKTDMMSLLLERGADPA
ncbi:hypothetical protein QQS21_002499 [Conoideocrella luteorostrata]|uniref:BZIP domain-containing protein n=1 Tax=Conoideocrella luteorostrata TaxID=1105319 RepID=A0AAJ0CY22_9HYPO|nr:hypothetical protein QQS21_002499 [Conoideocrella luteorostrata]